MRVIFDFEALERRLVKMPVAAGVIDAHGIAVCVWRRAIRTACPSRRSFGGP
ncbi:hypothetical protein RMSM_00716, partial [Rhodopirellula maiorica SM1]